LFWIRLWSEAPAIEIFFLLALAEMSQLSEQEVQFSSQCQILIQLSSLMNLLRTIMNLDRQAGMFAMWQSFGQ
jgi:hypothetical protein